MGTNGKCTSRDWHIGNEVPIDDWRMFTFMSNLAMLSLLYFLSSLSRGSAVEGFGGKGRG